ncbi:DUF4817 domain-containing protein [Trichonephila clavipes]|nr:DUF4817 domain-containing protein [Trichonephila clavipes]
MFVRSSPKSTSPVSWRCYSMTTTITRSFAVGYQCMVFYKKQVHAPLFSVSIPEQESAQHCQVIYSQFGLAIHQNDHQARRRFVEWAQNEIAIVPDFHKRILFSDEAHFWLNGYVNKQNCRIWSEANPQVYVETPLHPEKLTVWCALWAGGIIGPYFFKNDEGHNVTVNGDRYRAMITNFFIPELNNHDVQELWFEQDGATCHTARATIDLLKDTFGDRLISRFGPGNWLPRSCDLTPLDYFLWGYVKSLVYADKPQTLDHLEDNIRRVIADIRPQMLGKGIENWTSRLDYIRASRGSPMPEIIFKINRRNIFLFLFTSLLHQIPAITSHFKKDGIVQSQVSILRTSRRSTDASSFRMVFFEKNGLPGVTGCSEQNQRAESESHRQRAVKTFDFERGVRMGNGANLSGRA